MRGGRCGWHMDADSWVRCSRRARRTWTRCGELRGISSVHPEPVNNLPRTIGGLPRDLSTRVECICMRGGLTKLTRSLNAPRKPYVDTRDSLRGIKTRHLGCFLDHARILYTGYTNLLHIFQHSHEDSPDPPKTALLDDNSAPSLYPST